MQGWFTNTVVAIALLAQFGAGVSAQLPDLPPQPSQDQIDCHDEAWAKDNLAQVADVRLNKQLVPFVKKLLADSKTTGYTMLITSGYRDCALQKHLRQMYCGTDNYSVTTKPADDCAPPTEPAGRSLHNDGLAVDFSCQGYTNFDYSPCYQWLRNEAAKYQLKNRPGESWHWSTTGR